MKNTYGLPTFFAFYVFFVWSIDGHIQFDAPFIDQTSCEAVANTFNEHHYVIWKNKYEILVEALKFTQEPYPPDWKGKCVPASEWPF